ncbi:U4/U6 small nuclear ribonucleoprotein prp4 [Didymosphaeria variabile]|uniref:U4/U6 small nuclear ribonucleoprotein prp4 n=1 Tax=Didymosphaeria variabile TaxID=1932322 RepID=A0A9W8XI05_9PLEO|nr:U4/U6 small nuclear ribonucleoprotein prp4 [Didymosphaeria variabile]KAJ4349771.1 U4/U6 small nuclear ribonucleoprotein prp4 [Didymosphaeria variabile]
MASRASSSSEGEVIEHQQKANSISQSSERTINGSSRAFGGDGASDDHGRSYDPRSHNKRKASPSRGGRPDKRHHTDRNRPNDHRPDSRYNDPRTALHQGGPYNDRKPSKPLSYADTDHPPTVPDFREHLRPLEKPRSNGSSHTKRDQGPLREESRNGQVSSKSFGNSNKSQAASAPQAGADGDVQMSVIAPSSGHYSLIGPRRTQAAEGPDMSFEPAVQEQALAQETREEKRRRWAAIRAAAEKDKAKDNLLHQALLANASESTTPNVASPIASIGSPVSPVGSPPLGDLNSVPPSPDVMIIDKQGATGERNSPSAESPSAADYDPIKDMLDDRDRAARKARQTELPSDAYSETDPKVLSTLPAEKVGPIKKQKKDFDMFDFDEDEDGAEAEADVVEEAANTAKGTVLDEKLLDNWDDAEGYYKLIANELVNGGRYRMIKNLGRGVFANVAQAEDISIQDDNSNHKLVAIKMIRRNDLMRKASQKEMDFVRKVNDADPQDKRHVIRLLSSFDHKGHLCAVFEHMSKNLRDLLKENTNGHGLSLQAVRSYSRQMFIGLQHLQNCQVVHCDLKPDNILVSPDMKTIKLCDFGTAVDKRDVMERTEYLVSRFYRAPEIILGLDIGYGIDMWAIGCTIYELWTGKILFTGRTNNQMIKAFMDCLGWPTEKLLKKGLLQNVLEHFEAGPPLKFISQEVDQQGKVCEDPQVVKHIANLDQVTVRKIEQQKKIPRDLKSRINDATRGMSQDNLPPERELNDFVDLLGACLNFNPEKRMQPKEALQHKFFPQPKLAPRTAVVKPPMVKRPMSAFRR